MELEDIRKRLDELDKELVVILAKRISLIPGIAEYKKKHKIPRYQPEREKEIIEEKRKLAKELNLDQGLVEDIFKRIIQESHKIEKDIIGE